MRLKSCVALLLIELANCGGRVERDLAESATPDAGETTTPVRRCALCIDAAETYCGDTRCLTGAEYCAIYGCSPCADCGELSCMVNICGDPWY